MNIIINGGTRGIGKAVVKNLARDAGNQILVTGRNKESLAALSASHKNVKSLPLYMSAFESQQERFRIAVTETLGSVDILINMAGFLVKKEFLDLTNDEARLMIETNFFGPAMLIRTIKPMMHPGAHIVNISSMGGFQGSAKYKGLSVYSASKAALGCLSECLALEFKEFGISVNCLALGAVQTEMFNEAFPGYEAPLDARQMAEFISGFALNGHKYFNGKILPVATGNP